MSSSKPEFIRVGWGRKADDAASFIAPGFRHIAWDIAPSRSYESLIWDAPASESGPAPTAPTETEQVQTDVPQQVSQIHSGGMTPLGVAEVDLPVRHLTDKQLEALRAEAFERGRKAGEISARTRLERALAGERELLKSMTTAVTALTQRPDALFEPLRRLALHLAQALARSELTISPQAIDRLVRNCLSRIDGPISRAVVTLNPDDLRLVLDHDPDLADGLKFEADTALSQGSIRIRADDTVVKDLMEDRVQSLVDSLLSPCDGAADLTGADPDPASNAGVPEDPEGGNARLQ